MSTSSLFYVAWEGLQIVLHLVEPVIQRKRRLETKRSMLEDWLRRLVARAKQVRRSAIVVLLPAI